MPPQSRAAHGFAGTAVKIDLIRKGLMTSVSESLFQEFELLVKIDLIRKGIMTGR